jgi:hypothetical protein
MKSVVRILTQEQIEQILYECRLFDNLRTSKDYDAGIAQGKKEIGYQILEIIYQEMPDIAKDFVLKAFEEKVKK